jgi:peroxiredoxin
MKKKRPWVVVAVAVALVGLMLWKKQQIQYAALSWLVLHEEAPGELAMREMVESSSDPVAALTKLWDTKRIVQREFVGNFVRERAFGRPDPLWPQERPLTLVAACGCDMETQQAALGVLSLRQDPQFVPLALAMLNDIDPGVRSLGMIALEQLNDRRLVPVFVRMLEDVDEGVRTYAAGALSELTNQDFDAKFAGSGAAAGKTLDLWRQWWAANRGKYDPSEIPAPAAECEQPLGLAPEFSLPDLDGKNVRLSDLRGKPVLLVFWAASSANSLAQVPELSEFQRKRGGEASLLAIEAGDWTGKGESIDDVKQFVADQKIPYRVLIDKKASAMAAYSGGDFPAAIWIDKNGLIRRRFVGLRKAKVLEQMLDWVNQG